MLNPKEPKVAFDFFNKTIQPVLSNHDAFSELKNQNNGFSIKENWDAYSYLVKSILKFKKCEGYESNMESFKDAIIKTLKPGSYEKLFESFATNINGCSSIKQILDLFKYRADWLEDKIKETELSVSNAKGNKFAVTTTAKNLKNWRAELAKIKAVIV